MRSRIAVLAAVVLALTGVAGCAGVPASSPVQVLRKVGGDEVPPPPGPVAGSEPLDVVRDFVTASASSADKHGAARRFLVPEAQNWDDAAGLTVLAEGVGEGQIDTVPAPGSGTLVNDALTVRIRGTKIGRVTPVGAFEPDAGPFQADVDLVRRDGQWRISRLPAGVVVGSSDFRANYRGVRIWFVDPTRRRIVPDLRYIANVPSQAMPARVVELLLGGPSSALTGAVGSRLAPNAKLRANVALDPDNAVVVDLTQLGELDDGARRLLAAQIVASLAEISVVRVRLLADGEPLVAGHPEWTRDEVVELSGESTSPLDAPPLVVVGGRISTLSGTGPATPLPGAVGNGSVDVVSAATSSDVARLAIVARSGASSSLMVGRTADGNVMATGVSGPAVSRPTWTPAGDEVWVVQDAKRVTRVRLDAKGAPVEVGGVDVGDWSSIGPITDLRISRDGMRVAAVVGGGLYTAAVARGLDGRVTIVNARRLGGAALGEVVAVGWRSADSVVAVTRSPRQLVTAVTVDGLDISPQPTSNLTPPLTALAATANRPLLVTDQTGVWNLPGGGQDAWRLVLGTPGAVPVYPG